MAKLEVQIGADSSELNAEIAAAEVKIERLGKLKVERVKLGLDVKELNSDISQAKAQLVGLNKTVATTGSSFGGMTPKVANGGNALMQFSRIAQDAPFGIIGIGNNLTATAEAFAHLKNQTGSTGGALKALAGSLMGSGGILLGVSLLTTAFTFMAQKGLSVGDVIDMVTGKFNESRKSMQELNIEAIKGSAGQISAMNALVSVANNVKLADSDRLIAVKKLQAEYPAYFGNLTQEQILNGNVAGAVRGVTKALIAKAKAAAAVDRIVKLSEEEEKIQNNIKNELAEVARGYQLNKKEAFEFAKAVLEGADAFKLLDPFKKRAGFFDVANAVALNNTLDKLNIGLTANRLKQDKLTEGINESTAAYIKLEQAATKAAKAPKAATAPKGKKVDFEEGFIPGGIVAPAINFDSALLSMDIVPDAVNEKLLAVENALLDFNKRAREIINSSIADTFIGLGTAIGGALASGGNVMQAAGKALLGSVGALLTNLGTMAIQVGVGLIGIKAALKTLNPALAIGAGVALIALGAVFSSKASALGSSGGSSGGGSVSTGASVSSPTSSTGGGGGSSFQGGTVVFEISGQSLIGVLGNTLDKNRRLGGALSLG